MSVAFQHSGVALGYGYGYGVCSASRPSDLEAEYVNNDRRIEFSWAVVEFSNCVTAATSSYRLQVRKTDATLIGDYEDITTTHKRITKSTLKTNKPYQFKVRAIASDDETTEWSLYKSFRTLPKKPADLTVTQVNNNSVQVMWDNVPRSKKLQYYQVVVKRGSHVVFSKRLSLGLRKNQTGTEIAGLKSDVEYRVKVRAVARSTSKGDYAKKYFTLN